MIVYSASWRRAQAICRMAQRWQSAGIVTSEQRAAICARYATPLYTPNLFVAIGLFVFATLATCGVVGLFFLGSQPRGRLGFAALCLGLGGMTYAALEGFVHAAKLYRAGIDEALLYVSLALCIVGCEALVDPSPIASTVLPYAMPLPFLAWAVVRFDDRVAAAGLIACLMALVVVPLSSHASTLGLLPWVIMAAAVGLYVLTRWVARADALYPWESARSTVEVLALVLFYAAGNAYVGPAVLGELAVADGSLHQSGPTVVSWLLTALVPLLYCGAGLFWRQRQLLWLGLLATSASVLTVRRYVHVMSLASLFTIAGFVLLVLIAAAIRLLRVPRAGFTSTKLFDAALWYADAEALLLTQALSPSASTTQPRVQGKGGEFGGGGASGEW